MSDKIKTKKDFIVFLVELLERDMDGNPVLKEDGTRKCNTAYYCSDGGNGYDKEDVDYGDCWHLSVDGELVLSAEDGIQVIPTEYLWDQDLVDITALKFTEMVGTIDAGYKLERGRWMEWRVNPSFDIRVTALAEPPRLSAEKTREASDLNVAQMHAIKIYGVPLFQNGENDGRYVLDDGLGARINGMWQDFVKSAVADKGFKTDGIKVEVEDYSNAEGIVGRAFKVEAKYKDCLMEALKVLGARNPDKLPVKFTSGVGDTTDRYGVDFYLVDEIV